MKVVGVNESYTMDQSWTVNQSLSFIPIATFTDC